MTSPNVSFDVIARDKATRTFDKVGRESDGLGKKLGDFAKKGATAVAAFAAAGAAAATALAAAGANFALEKSKADALLAGQVGAAGQVKELGKVTGALYVEGWAESAGQAADAVRATIQNKLIGPDAGADAIKAMSTRVAALAAQMGQDFQRVSAAVSTMLRTGIAGSAEEAFDLLTVATSKGVDKSQDLLDTMIEYSVQFKALGIDAPKALGLMAQALDAGGRNADVAADAIKEFAIRSKDGSVLSRKAFQDLGLDADSMFQVFARGGPAADAAMKQVIDQLKAMKNPVERDAAAVALFGTKAEDLQSALFAFDPTTAVDALGKVTGASDDFIQSQSSAGQRLDQIWRGAVAAIADKLLPFIEKIISAVEKWVKDPAVQEWFADLKAQMDRMADELLPILTAAFGFMAAMWADHGDDIIAVIVGFVAALGLLLAAVMAVVGAVGFLADMMSNAFRIAVQAALGYIGTFINAAALAFGWIPGLGDKLKQAAENFDDFKHRVNNALAGIADRHVKVQVTATGIRFTGGGPGAVGTIPFGGGFQERAHGGPVVAGRPYIVGEHRPELFVPDSNGVILPSVPSAVSSGGGSNVIELRASGFGDSVMGRMFLSWLQGALRANPGVRLTTA